MTRDEMRLQLETMVSPKRLKHSLNVMNTAVNLAKKYGVDTQKAEVAGLLHDCARDIRGEEVFILCGRYGIGVDSITQHQPELLHGPLGAELARNRFDIQDEEILNAIRCHTTGRKDMSFLDKIIFIADYIEPGRGFDGVERLRKAVQEDLDLAIVRSLDCTIRHVLSKGALVHPDTIHARNSVILEKVRAIAAEGG